MTYSIFMKKEKTVSYFLFKNAAAFKIAVVLTFFMFINMLNFSSFIDAGHASAAGKHILEIDNKIGKIYGIVNLPVQIVNEIFGGGNFLSSCPGGVKDSEKNASFALFIPVKKAAKKTGETLFLSGITCFAQGTGKTASKSSAAPPGVLYSGGNCISGYLESNDTVRFMLLFLILSLSLPRAIPVKIKKYKNIILHFPSLFANKDGIFRFIGKCKGSLK